MRILYSFNKRGPEAEFWTRELAAASNDRHQFIPFNHDPYVALPLYVRAQLLDNLYFDRHPGLMRLYSDFEEMLGRHRIEAVIVDNQFPYHPDYLRRIPVYKVLRMSDGPIVASDRDFVYLHSYDHALYHSPAYSRDMDMAEKLRYCGVKNADFWPLGLFESRYDSRKTEDELFTQRRDIDVLFIGAMHLNKMPQIARMKKALGKAIRIHGFSSLKKNVYFNLKYGFPGWIRAVDYDAILRLYQRSKIGINVHNRGDYTVGNYRLFELPANGVMQISDGGDNLERFFRVDQEIVRYGSFDELVEKTRWYLDHDQEREQIARAAYQRVLKDYRMADMLQRAGDLIESGMRSRNTSEILDQQTQRR